MKRDLAIKHIKDIKGYERLTNVIDEVDDEKSSTLQETQYLLTIVRTVS